MHFGKSDKWYPPSRLETILPSQQSLAIFRVSLVNVLKSEDYKLRPLMGSKR
jgi:hypothetical protein